MTEPTFELPDIRMLTLNEVRSLAENAHDLSDFLETLNDLILNELWD